jgi:hypothetical protein
VFSKLPQDLLDVMHILPFWFKYLYWFLWIAGIALIASLAIHLLMKLFRHLQEQKAVLEVKKSRERNFSRTELQHELKNIHRDITKSKEYRLGLHRISRIVKTYFEILLKKNIEEMTAKEITNSLHDKKELGIFFTELTVTQFSEDNPEKDDFVKHYEDTFKIVK